jgi:hypothetical protein
MAKFDNSNIINSEFQLGFDKKNEEPGSTNSSTLLLNDFNKYQDQYAQAKFYYGQKISTGQIVLGYNYNNREYTNNEQSFRDAKQNKVTATFFYRVTPKTRLLISASSNQYKYDDRQINDNVIFNQSNRENLYQTGLEWDATAKTTGIVRIGYEEKTYDDSQFSDISGLSYNVDMIWKPSTYTKINLNAKRQASESAQLNESGFVNSSYSINVSHYITHRTLINTQYTLNKNNISARNNLATRTDKTHKIKLGITHSLRKWLNINLNYRYQEKSSNIELLNYNSNTIELTLKTLFE